MVAREKEYIPVCDVKIIPPLPDVPFLDTIDFLEEKELSAIFGTTQEEVDSIASDWIRWAYEANKGKQIIEVFINESRLSCDYTAVCAYKSLTQWTRVCGSEYREIPMSLIRFFASKMSKEAQKDCESLIAVAGECPTGIDDEQISRDFIFDIGKAVGYVD